MAVVCTTLYISKTAGTYRVQSSHHQAVLGSGLPVLATLDQFGGGEREAERPDGHDDERHDARLFTHHGCQAQPGHFPQRAGVRLRGTARERGNISVQCD